MLGDNDDNDNDGDDGENEVECADETDEVRRFVIESFPSSSSSSSSSRRRFSERRSGGVCGTVGLGLEEGDGEGDVEVGVEGEAGSDLRDWGGDDEIRSNADGRVSMMSSSSSG